MDDWVKNNDLCYRNSKITFDSEQPFIWSHDFQNNNVSQSYIRQDFNSIEISTPICQDIDVCPMTGDAYILVNKEIIGNSNVYGGKIVYYSNFLKKSADITLLDNKKTYNLCGASEIAYDYIRKKIWISDTFNNKILCVNADTKQIELITKRNDIIYPSAIAVDPVTGNAFAKAYYYDGLQEVMIIIKNKEIYSIFKTPGNFGWKNNENPMNFFFLLSNNLTNNTSSLNKIDLHNGKKIGVYENYNESLTKLTTEAINNSIVSYGLGGNIRMSLYDNTQAGSSGTFSNIELHPFPCLTDASHWCFSSRPDGMYNLTRIQIRNKDAVLIENSDVLLRNPVCGKIIHYERCPVVISENGMELIKISSDGKVKENRRTLSEKCNLIETHLNNEIFIAKSGQKYGYVFENNLTLSGTYSFTNNIKSIVSHHSSPKVYWVLFENNIVAKVFLEANVVSVTGTYAIPTANECLGIHYDFNTNRPVIYSRKGVYCLSEDGNSLKWMREDFEYISDISMTNNFYKLHNQHKWITRRSIKYDVLRNNLWWLSVGNNDQLCSLNTKNDSVSSFLLPKNKIRFEYESSSSTSSQQPLA